MQPAASGGPLSLPFCLSLARAQSFEENTAERLTTPSEYGNNGARAGWCFLELRPEQRPTDPFSRGPEIPAGEDGMDFEKDNLEDDNELSRLENDEELGGETEEIVEAEEELVIVGEEPEEESAAPASKPASKPAARKRAKKAAKKKAAPRKKAKKSKPKKKRGKKRARKPAKKKKKRRR